MATATAPQETEAQRKAREAKEQKDAERAAKAEAKEAERAEKAKQREAEKEAKAKEKVEAQAKRLQERITKLVGEVEWEGDAPTPDTVEKAKELVKARKAEIRAAKPKKAPLTLSQRRSVLNLASAGAKGIVPKSDFNALPLEHLVNVGLAEKFDGKRDVEETKTVEKEVKIPKAEQTEGGPTTKTVKEKVTETSQVDATGYRLTDAGKERATEINPKWQDWKPAPREASADDAAAAPEATPAS